MNKLKVRLTLDKLPDIHADLVRIDLDWQEWTFPQLAAALKKCTSRNQKIISNPEEDFKKKDKNYRQLDCIYCDNLDKNPMNAKQ